MSVKELVDAVVSGKDPRKVLNREESHGVIRESGRVLKVKGVDVYALVAACSLYEKGPQRVEGKEKLLPLLGVSQKWSQLEDSADEFGYFD